MMVGGIGIAAGSSFQYRMFRPRWRRAQVFQKQQTVIERVLHPPVWSAERSC